MEADYRRYRETRFFGSLDGLRAISIIGVIWFHCWFGTSWYSAFSKVPLMRDGPFGVDIFFTISGFLITTLLLRERDRYETISLRDFYIRRALRILPVYYAVLGLYVLLVAVERHSPAGRAFFHFLPTFLTFTYTWFGPSGGQTVPHFNFGWSLSTEEQFYFFWPFVLRTFRRAVPAGILLALIALSQFATLGPFAPSIAPLLRKILGSVSVAICLGALLAMVLHSRRGFDLAARVLGRKGSAPAAVALLTLVLAATDGLPAAWHGLAWLPLPLLIGSCVVREDNGLAKFLTLRAVATIGVLSYSMYLLNTLCIRAVRPCFVRVGLGYPLIYFPFVVVVTAGLAWLSYRYFESFFLALKQRFARVRPLPTLPQIGLPIESAEPTGSVHP